MISKTGPIADAYRLRQATEETDGEALKRFCSGVFDPAPVAKIGMPADVLSPGTPSRVYWPY